MGGAENRPWLLSVITKVLVTKKKAKQQNRTTLFQKPKIIKTARSTRSPAVNRSRPALISTCHGQRPINKDTCIDKEANPACSWQTRATQLQQNTRLALPGKVAPMCTPITIKKDFGNQADTTRKPSPHPPNRRGEGFRCVVALITMNLTPADLELQKSVLFQRTSV